MSKNLYQKYRPYTFDEVIGQDYAKTILLNSIKENMIQNTYLFNGPRGTGKTTIARIFSRLINCDSIENPGQDNCNSCKYFEENDEYDDIFELDAASNNGVDDIRKIIDSVKYQPIHLKKKVYIIDEVHMLSKGAFNALLKTLEEPQDKVVFILATTEVGKIPPTILSRCQRFDFERIPPNLLIELFKNILEKENINFEEEALKIISRLSDGCVRDGLSLLQKVISVKSNVGIEETNDALGLIEQEKYEKIFNFIETKNTDKLLEFWNELYLSGLNINTFIIDFQYYLKNKLLEESTYEILKVIYKINDIEQRAIYTKNLNSLIEVMFIELTNDLENPRQSLGTPNKTATIKMQQQGVNEDVQDIDKSKSSEILINDYKKVNTDNDLEKEDIVQEKRVQENKVQENKRIPFEAKTSNSETLAKDMDTIFDVLKTASKEIRVLKSKEFIEIGEKLQSIKKFGLAKFFLEGKIKAANKESIIVEIEEELQESFTKRHDKLCEEITGITTIKIINKSEWETLKIQYINRQKNTTVNHQEEPLTNEQDQVIINKLEDKLNKKITIIKE